VAITRESYTMGEAVAFWKQMQVVNNRLCS
jgi:hypothetical protein